MHQILGYSQEELSQIDQWDRIIHPDERKSGAQRYLELIEGKHDEDEWEQRFVQRDGQIVIANGRFRLLRDPAGKPQYIFSFNEDITRRKRAEAELVKAKESAEAATKSKSEFLANMSHEIRTPMNAILGMTHLALKTELTPKQRDYLTKTKAAAQSLLGIINDTSTSQKSRLGSWTLRTRSSSSTRCLKTCPRSLAREFKTRIWSFSLPLNKTCQLFCLGIRLGQVLINLVNNSRDGGCRCGLVAHYAPSSSCAGKDER